ncbi:MAG: hypothetical protein ACK587_04245 [Cyanobacteriota bacterium]|jgi:hypothetical protein
MDHWLYKSLDYSLCRLLETSEGISFLQALNAASISELGSQLLSEDPFHDKDLLATSVRCLWSCDSPLEFLCHCLWCAHREALWRMPASERGEIRLPVKITGSEHLLDTHNEATILIAPMTICMGDAIDSVINILCRCQPGRSLVIYGEDMDTYLKREPQMEPLFAPDTTSGIKKIRTVLNQKGIFMTYPDFVYSKHAVQVGELFGMARPYSGGFLSIAAASRATLLPLRVYYHEGDLELQFFSPVRQPDWQPAPPRFIQTQVIRLVVGKLLEGLIKQVPNQWRLLPTLSHDSEDMARLADIQA